MPKSTISNTQSQTDNDSASQSSRFARLKNSAEEKEATTSAGLKTEEGSVVNSRPDEKENISATTKNNSTEQEPNQVGEMAPDVNLKDSATLKDANKLEGELEEPIRGDESYNQEGPEGERSGEISDTNTQEANQNGREYPSFKNLQEGENGSEIKKDSEFRSNLLSSLEGYFTEDKVKDGQLEELFSYAKEISQGLKFDDESSEGSQEMGAEDDLSREFLAFIGVLAQDENINNESKAIGVAKLFVAYKESIKAENEMSLEERELDIVGRGAVRNVIEAAQECEGSIKDLSDKRGEEYDSAAMEKFSEQLQDPPEEAIERSGPENAQNQNSKPIISKEGVGKSAVFIGSAILMATPGLNIVGLIVMFVFLGKEIATNSKKNEDKEEVKEEAVAKLKSKMGIKEGSGLDSTVRELADLADKSVSNGGGELPIEEMKEIAKGSKNVDRQASENRGEGNSSSSEFEQGNVSAILEGNSGAKLDDAGSLLEGAAQNLVEAEAVRNNESELEGQGQAEEIDGANSALNQGVLAQESAPQAQVAGVADEQADQSLRVAESIEPSEAENVAQPSQSHEDQAQNYSQVAEFEGAMNSEKDANIQEEGLQSQNQSQGQGVLEAVANFASPSNEGTGSGVEAANEPREVKPLKGILKDSAREGSWVKKTGSSQNSGVKKSVSFANQNDVRELDKGKPSNDPGVGR